MDFKTMASIADSLPIEVLTQTLQHVQNAYRRQLDPYEEPPIFTAPIMDSNATEKRDFGHFRLVSRRWKAVADTLFFRDVSAFFGYPYYSRVLCFLEGVYREGYTQLVRNVHIQVSYGHNELEVLAHDPVESSAALILSYTDLVCDLIC